QRNVLACRPRVVEDRVALAERAAARVLPGEADGYSLEQEAAPGQRLGGGPVHLAPPPQQPRPFCDGGSEPPVEPEALRDGAPAAGGGPRGGGRAPGAGGGAVPTGRRRRPGAGARRRGAPRRRSSPPRPPAASPPSSPSRARPALRG